MKIDYSFEKCYVCKVSIRLQGSTSPFQLQMISSAYLLCTMLRPFPAQMSGHCRHIKLALFWWNRNLVIIECFLEYSLHVGSDCKPDVPQQLL